MKNSSYTPGLIASQFWLDTPLEKMNKAQWEAVCDGCGRCCLHKFINEDDLEQDENVLDVPSEGTQVMFTNIACRLLNEKTCACTSYEKRTELVPDCVSLSKESLAHIYFMPPSCSYRRLHEGKGLAKWHPLLNKGKKTQMHELGISVRNKVVKEADADLDNFEDYIVTWPISEID